MDEEDACTLVLELPEGILPSCDETVVDNSSPQHVEIDQSPPSCEDSDIGEVEKKSSIHEGDEKVAPSQIVKLPLISNTATRRNSNNAVVPLASGSSKQASLKYKLNNAGSSTGTQSPSVSVNVKSQLTTLPRQPLPGDSSTKVKQTSTIRNSIGSSSGNSTMSSVTGPLPEMKIASMKMQMAQKKAVPKASSVSLGGSYRYKIMPGNNSRVVMTSMRKRPWWHAILGNNAAEAEDQNDLSAIQPTFLWEMIRRACRYKTSQFHNTLMNHIQRNNSLVTKKGLYLSLKSYCQENSLDILSIVPRTYYLAPGEHSKSMKDDDMEDFLAYCNSVPGKRPEELVWILKPASKTNRGFGIKVVQGLDRVINIVQRGMSANSCDRGGETCGGGEESGEDDDEDDNNQPAAVVAASSSNPANTSNSMSAYDANPLNKQAKMIARTDGYIVQAYLERPLLVHGRKFDIRCFVLVTVFPTRRSKTSSVSSSGNNTVVASSPGVIDGLSDEEATAVANTAAAVEDATTKNNSSVCSVAKKGAVNAPSSPGRPQQQSLRNASSLSNNNSATNIHNGGNSSNVKQGATTGRSGKEKEVRAYFFQEAYIRTSCKKYVVGNFSDRETHLTNDAVQKLAKSYGQFEEGNKLSLPEWEQVLLDEYPSISRPGIVMDQIFPEIKRLSKLSIASVADEFSQTDINKSFELFGYDYMIREDLSPVLIEVNTNPCLEFVCPLLTQVISDVIEHTVRMTVDKELPPPPKSVRTKATEEAIAAINSSPIKFDALYP